VPDDQHRLQFRSRPAPVARHHVALAIIGPEHGHVRRWEACIEQPLRHCLRSKRGTSDRIRRIDFDQLLEHVVRGVMNGRIAERCAPGDGCGHGGEYDAGRLHAGTVFH
jgi:hypothetical protein